MKEDLKCIMLIDDNPDDNFFHEREIKKCNASLNVITKMSGLEALEYLKSMKKIEQPKPELIFLDINMPGMNGWEFLKEYNLLDNELKKKPVIIMLTTSDNPDDIARAMQIGFVSDYITKPLTNEKVKSICVKYF